MALAANVTERSIALSSSSKAATSVSYTVNFTAPTAAGAFVVDFCAESPIYGATCTAPTGFIASGAASASVGFTDVNALTSAAANKIEVTATSGISASDNVSVVLTGLTNPTAAGTIYARIVTFNTEANALAYTSTGSNTGKIDDGGVAIPITETIGVSGSVLESMTFCVAGQAISANCDLTGNSAPTLLLGEDPGTGVKSLTAGVLSTGDIYTQITTNASGGAVINLKSSAENCGGLINSSNPTGCFIAPALSTGGITAATDAKFGVKLNTPTGTGTLQAAASSGYNNTNYRFNYVAGNATGVTSTYGDPFLDTADAPASNMNMRLTFGASAQADTPAGNYSADLGLIATGKF
jgi:hypothetical protein